MSSIKNKAELQARPGAVEAPAAGSQRANSYGQILKSSAMIGGSSVINIGLSMVRVKAMAVLLGPSGVGLMGLYGSIADLAQCVAGMGINGSGVRQIAEAAGSGDSAHIARTAGVLKRIAALLGFLGAMVLCGLSRQLSVLSFGNAEHAGAIVWLSLAVFFGSIAGGRSALVQGMRRIGDLARMSIIGGVCGLAVSLPWVYWLGSDGVIPAMISVAAMTMGVSWWFSRRIILEPVSIDFVEFRSGALQLLMMGLAFMASGILTMGAAYAVRLLVVRQSGLEAGGLYQSAWGLGGLYVGFILQAMGADFYPRLTAAAKDDVECNRLVNEQAQVSLLLAGPGVIATLTFAPLVIPLFYSSRFAGAVEILRWICLGMALRVIAWPMGFILLAKGAQKAFFWTELAATLVHLALAWFCISRFGPAGAGMAFFGLYIWHGFLVYGIVNRLTGFFWGVENKKTGQLYLLLIAVSFSAFYIFPFWVTTLIGVGAGLVSGLHSLRVLTELVSPSTVPAPLRRLLTRLRLIAPAVS